MQNEQRMNVFDATMVSPYALLFFGGHLEHDFQHTVSIDHWIK